MQSERLVNVVRGLALLAAVLAAYLAQHLYLHGTVSTLLPPRLVNAFPFLSHYLYRPASGLLMAALWTFVIAAVAFGLLTPLWREAVPSRACDDSSSSSGPNDSDNVPQSESETWRILLGAAGALSLLSALILLLPSVAWLSYLLLGSAAGLYLWAGFERERSAPSAAMARLLALLDTVPANPLTDLIRNSADGTKASAPADSLSEDNGHHSHAEAEAPASEASPLPDGETLHADQGDSMVGAATPLVHTASLGTVGNNTTYLARLDRGPLRGWPYLAGILLLATIAYVLRWMVAPTTIDSVSAEIGLFAQGNADAATRASMNVSNVPGLAATVATLFTRLTGNGLVGLRMAGLYAGLLLTTTVWLLAAEIFRRSPDRQLSDLYIDDDLLVRILATSIAAFGLPVLYFARGPVLLEGVAWGSLGLWALLYGLRTGLLPAVGISAVLLGVAALFGPNGLTLIAVGLSIWAGAFILRPGWPCFDAETASPFRRRTLLYWSLGLILMLLPLFTWLVGPSADLASYLSFNAVLDGTYSSLFVRIGANATLSLGVAATDMLGALLAPTIAAGAAGLLGVDTAMLSVVIAPFFILGLGALALNLDTFGAWTLAAWLLLGAALSVLFAYPLAPHWSSLLVMWPAVALTTAFALDRLRAAVTECTGGWTRQASLYLTAGLVAAAAVFGWLTFHEGATQHVDSASAVGREVRRALTAGESAVVVSTEPWTPEELTVLAFLTDMDMETAQTMLTGVDALPTLSGSETRFVLAGDDRSTLQYLSSTYPAASPKIFRDLNGNPVAYSYASGSDASE